MTSMTFSLPLALLEELTSIDWQKLGYHSKSEWVRELVRENLPNIKTKNGEK